jgi:hypothetical protein
MWDAAMPKHFWGSVLALMEVAYLTGVAKSDWTWSPK